MEFTEQGKRLSHCHVCPSGSVLSVCAGAGARALPGGLREPPSEELRGLGSRGERGKEKGLGGEPEQKQRVMILFPFILFYFIISISPHPCVFFPPANPLGATLAKRDAFFIQPPRPGSVKLHFFSEALLRGKKKLEATDRQMLLVVVLFFVVTPSVFKIVVIFISA